MLDDFLSVSLALLIIDNYKINVSNEALTFAKNNGVIVLTLSPHCSRKMQPLHVSVFKAFKIAYNKAIEICQLNNSLQRVSIYQLASLLNGEFCTAFTLSNIIFEFTTTGIHPYNTDVFQRKDFLNHLLKLFKGTETLIDDFPLDDPVSSLDTVVAPDSPLISSASKISQSTENGES